GGQKMALEMVAQHLSRHFGYDICIPRLAGVLSCTLPEPANGTTERLDWAVICAAAYAVYGNSDENPFKDRFNKDGKYVPELTADANFALIDGSTLPPAVLSLLHQDLRSHHGPKSGPGPVHNFTEYTVTMGQAMDMLKEEVGKHKPGFDVAWKAPAR